MSDEAKRNLGANLVRLREGRGIDRAQAARDLGVTWRAYANWEAGERMPNLPEGLALARYYKVSPFQLLEGC